MPNLSKSDSFTSSKIGVIDVGQFNFDIPLNVPGATTGIWGQIDSKTAFNIVSIASVYNEAGYIPFSHIDAQNMMQTGGLRDGDIAWSTNKEAFNNTISWLWGDLEGGGVGLVRFETTSSDIRFVESHGIFYDEENDYERIGFLVNSIIRSDQINAVSFNYYYWMVRDTYAANDAVYVFTNVDSQTPFAYKIYTNTLGVISYSDYVTTSSLGIILNQRYQTILTSSYPYFIIDCATLTTEQRVPIIAFHQTYNFNFGDEYIQEGNIHGDDEPENEENSQGGTSTGGGGGGGFDTSSDSSNRVTESQFSIDAINSGFVTIYTPSQANIQAFSDFLFTGITEDISTVLKRLISSPLDYVISLNMVHYTPTTGAIESIKFCGIDSGVNAARVTQQMKILNCGSINIDEQFKSFMDYSGHSKCKIYLPYCGIFPLEINEIMGGSLSLQYIIDNLTGACIAQLYITRYRNHVGSQNESFIDDRLTYEFTGNVFEQVPLSAIDYRGTIQGLMQVSGGVAAVAAGNGAGVGAIASGVMNLAPDVQHSGNASTSFGYMGVQIPYIILERQVQNYPIEFQQREGLTSNIYSKLNDLSGYTEIDIESFKTEYLKCTDAERDELLKILGGGFII